MDWLMAFSAVMFPILLLVGLGLKLLLPDVQGARIPVREKPVKIVKR